MKIQIVLLVTLLASNATASETNMTLVCSGKQGLAWGNSTYNQQYSVARNDSVLNVNNDIYSITEDGPVYIMGSSNPENRQDSRLKRIVLDRLSGELWIGDYQELLSDTDAFDKTTMHNGAKYFLNNQFSGTCKKVEPLL